MVLVSAFYWPSSESRMSRCNFTNSPDLNQGKEKWISTRQAEGYVIPSSPEEMGQDFSPRGRECV